MSISLQRQTLMVFQIFCLQIYPRNPRTNILKQLEMK